MKPFELINLIVDLAEIGNFFNRHDLSVHSFGLGDNAVNFTGENVTKFQEAIEGLFAADREIEQSYTFKEFEKRFISQFAESLRQKTHVTKEDVAEFFQDLKSVEAIEKHGLPPDSGCSSARQWETSVAWAVSDRALSHTEGFVP